MNTSGTLRVDGERLWNSLMEMARIGATAKGGVCRLALTDEDRAGRLLFTQWCEEAGCRVTYDAMGNMFARRPGTSDHLPPIVIGSHLDSQPTGGKFDGVYGVLAGLEVLRTLNDTNVETGHPVEVAVWTNEEGARFAPAMIGSGVFGGAFELDYALSREDSAGRTLGEELERIGYAGDLPVGGRRFAAQLEAHIEQGPILENESRTIGVVTGVQGINWYDLTVTGKETHAGPSPMALRHDPVWVTAELLTQIREMTAGHGPDARATIGQMEAIPGSRNTVPGTVRVSVDLRHPALETLEAMERDLHHLAATHTEGKISVSLERVWHSPPVTFDPGCIDAIRNATQALGYPGMDIVSGAGHDSVYISGVAPTAMVFVPCEDGLSHNEAENAAYDDLEAGCNVLLHAVLFLDRESQAH